MRGVYEASAKISALSAAKTLLYLTAPANKVVEILSVAVTNCTNETNEQLECKLTRITTLGTPTATTLTPTPQEAGDQAAGSTVKANCSSEPTTYATGSDFGAEGWATIGGYRYQPVPEERPLVGGGASIGLQLVAAPALGSFDADVRIVFREIG